MIDDESVSTTGTKDPDASDLPRLESCAAPAASGRKDPQLSLLRTSLTSYRYQDGSFVVAETSASAITYHGRPACCVGGGACGARPEPGGCR
jgi:hypothetical protein